VYPHVLTNDTGNVSSLRYEYHWCDGDRYKKPTSVPAQEVWNYELKTFYPWEVWNYEFKTFYP